MGAGVIEFYSFEAPNLRILVAAAFVLAISKQALGWAEGEARPNRSRDNGLPSGSS